MEFHSYVRREYAGLDDASVLVLIQEDHLLEGTLQEGVKLTTHDTHLEPCTNALSNKFPTPLYASYQECTLDCMYMYLLTDTPFLNRLFYFGICGTYIYNKYCGPTYVCLCS